MNRDTVLHDYTVVIRNGRVLHMGPSARVRVPAGARRIDGRGEYLVPALADLHVHLRYLMGARDNEPMLRLFLANGVTTVLNLLGMPEHLVLRDEIARGVTLGPDLWTSGFFVSPPFARTAGEGDSAVRAQRVAGYDFVKIHADFPKEAYHRVMRTAREVGIPVVGHAQRRLGIDETLAEGQPLVHLEEYLYAYFFFKRHTPIPPDSVKELVADASRRTRRAAVPVMPTLAVFCGIASQVMNLDSVLARPEVGRVPARIVDDWRPGKNPYTRERFPNPQVLEDECKLLGMLAKQMQEDGVLLVSGTDTPIASVIPGYSMHDELRLLVEAGLTPYQALRTATVNAATFLGTPGQFGQVTEGARADLLLLPADPRHDLSALRRLHGVMVRGRWFDPAALVALMLP
jgi:imidazolonepropionase-like amidohydrolase